MDSQQQQKLNHSSQMNPNDDPATCDDDIDPSTSSSWHLKVCSCISDKRDGKSDNVGMCQTQSDILHNSIIDCRDSTELILQRHSDYLSVIEELKCGFDRLSAEVNAAQKTFAVQDQECRSNMLEMSMKEMEHQNDLLKQALEDSNRKDELFLRQLKNNEDMKCELKRMQYALYQKDQDVKDMNDALCQLQGQSNMEMSRMGANLDAACQREQCLQENLRQLKDEIKRMNEKHGDLNTKLMKLTSLLKTQEDSRMDLNAKYERKSEQVNELQEQLKCASCTINNQADYLSKLQAERDQLFHERNILRNELDDVKEKEGIVCARISSMENEIDRLERELERSHECSREQQRALNRNEHSQSEVLSRLKAENLEMKRKVQSINEAFKCIQAENEKFKEANKANECVIESFRKWKEAQLESDCATRETIQQYEDHIRMLLEEKQYFVDKFRSMHCDFAVIETELDRLKRSISLSAMDNSQSQTHNSILERIEQIRRTSMRFSEQCGRMANREQGGGIGGGDLERLSSFTSTSSVNNNESLRAIRNISTNTNASETAGRPSTDGRSKI